MGQYAAPETSAISHRSSAKDKQKTFEPAPHRPLLLLDDSRASPSLRGCSAGRARRCRCRCEAARCAVKRGGGGGAPPTPRSANRSPTPAPLRRALFRRRAPPLEGAEWAMNRGGWAKNAVVWSTCRRYIVHGLALRELSRQLLPGGLPRRPSSRADRRILRRASSLQATWIDQVSYARSVLLPKKPISQKLNEFFSHGRRVGVSG